MDPRIYVDVQKHRAAGRGREWTLTEHEAIYLVTQKCFYCGEKPYEGCGGIDRIENDKGYVRGNCVPCCGYCNIMKGILSREEFLLRVKRICANQHLY